MTEKIIRRLTQAEANYSPVSTRLNAGQACAACRWYDRAFCLLVEPMPAAIEATGGCDRFEAAPEPAVVSVTEEPAGDDMAAEQRESGNERTGEAPATSTPGRFLGAIKSFFGVGGSDPGASVFKALGDGLWFAAYTNNFKDLEGEILAQAAHDRYIARLDAGFVPMPELWHVHEPATKHGQATHVWRDGHVVYAIGRFDETPAGKAAEKFYRRCKPGDIELSHGFHYPRWAKSAEGIYEDYNTFEITTILSRYGRGANPYTSFEEIETMALTEQKKQSIIDTFGQQEAERIFAATDKMQARAKALADAGIAYKDFADVNDTAPKPAPADDAFKAVIGDVLEGQAELIEAVEKIQSLFDAAMKQIDAERKELAEVRAGMEAATKALQTMIDAKPLRVDEAAGTIVADADANKQLDEQAGADEHAKLGVFK